MDYTYRLCRCGDIGAQSSTAILEPAAWPMLVRLKARAQMPSQIQTFKEAHCRQINPRLILPLLVPVSVACALPSPWQKMAIR